MLFNSLQFLLFYPFVTLLYYVLPHKHRWWWLLGASAVFYMAFVPVYLLILVFTILVDYAAGIWIENASKTRKKAYLLMSLAANVGILATFKYYNFFADNLNALFGNLDWGAKLPLLSILLPIGLSFHTFQAMSYTIEVYRGKQKAERHLGIFALYVLFYPQLVAGPIERPQNLLHQFRTYHPFNAVVLYGGLRLMLWGFFKKMVIADRLSVYVNHIYGNPFNYNAINLIIATLFFTIQIYCDFSGYSDIAIGAARSMGFTLMTNFNRPYFATNIRIFWQRWHISLSTWFRDYVYLPLGGSRTTQAKIYRNVAIVFLLSGFWHGANWTFLAWGSIHTLLIVGYLLYTHYLPIKLPSNKWANGVYTFITFCVVAWAWVFFRADSMSQALQITHNMLTFNTQLPLMLAIKNAQQIEFGTLSYAIALPAIAFMFWVEKWQNPHQTTLDNKPFADVVFNILVLLSVLILGVFYQNSFIYFQF
jgi:alginate O-acetyltransferase complex protein AlgI